MGSASPARIGHERNANADVAGCAFHDDAARLKLAALLGVVDDGWGRSILDRTARIEKFSLAVDVATCDVRRRAQPDQWRIANGFSENLIEHSHLAPSSLFRFLASARNGHFNGACADFGNFFVG
jgi:hypothetical protein